MWTLRPVPFLHMIDVSPLPAKDVASVPVRYFVRVDVINQCGSDLRPTASYGCHVLSAGRSALDACRRGWRRPPGARQLPLQLADDLAQLADLAGPPVGVLALQPPGGRLPVLRGHVPDHLDVAPLG